MNQQFLLQFKTRPWVRRSVWFIVAMLTLWGIAWLAVPPLLLIQGASIASEKLGRKVEIGRVEFSPWTLELSVHDVRVATADGRGTQAQFKRAYLNAQLQSLLRFAWVLDAVEIDEPVIYLKLLEPGHFDVDDVIKRLVQPADPQAQPVRLVLKNIALQKGSVVLHDEGRDRVHTLRHLQFSAPYVSNLASENEVKVTPRLAFELNGSTFDTAAESTPFADGRQTQAAIRVESLDIAPYLVYLPGDWPVRLQSAVLDAELHLSFGQTPQTHLKVSGNLQAKDVKVADGQQQELLSLGGVKLRLGDLQPLARKLSIDALELDSPHLFLRRNAAGALDWSGAGRARAFALGTAQPAQATHHAGDDWRISLARASITQGRLSWQDDSLPGVPARLELRDLVLDASHMSWPVDQAAQLTAQASVADAGGGLEQGRLAFDGRGTDKEALGRLSVQGLSLGLAAPYLTQFVKLKPGGQMDGEVLLEWNAPALVARVPRMTINAFDLACQVLVACQPLYSAGLNAPGKESVVHVAKLSIENAVIDGARRAMGVERLLLGQPRTVLARSADGRWMFEQWRANAGSIGDQASAGARKGAAATEPPWSLHLGAVEVDDGAVAFQDASKAAPVGFAVSSIKLRLKDFDPLPASAKPAALSVSARIGAGRTEPGRLQYEGSLALAPLSAQGRVLASQVPLQALEPYWADALNLDIRRADGAFQGQVRYAAPPAGTALQLTGDVAVDRFRARTVASAAVADGGGHDPVTVPQAEELLAWKSLGLRGFHFAMEPGQATVLDVREAALSDFFARVILEKTGRFNLQDVFKKPAAAGASSESGKAVVATVAPLIRLGPTTLTGGQVKFTDYFIQPNYSADLSEMTGRLGAFASAPAVVPGAEGGSETATADLELRGLAQGTATVEISGKFNPLVTPLALNIQGRVRDLDLPPLSPYSIKYAGHGLEHGKLSMDVAYEVLPDGQLTANNKLVLRQLTFSEPVPGAPTSLPVRLAAALLADSHGVIDLDLPIRGSINDPEFSVGGVIFRMVVNLVGKALTAPFALIARAFGGADELGQVVFSPGGDVLDDDASGKLGKVAQSLADRPTLTVTVAGKASLQAEREGWKRKVLHQRVLAEKRRIARREGAAAAALTEVGQDEYPALLKAVYRRSDVVKPRNLIGVPKDLPVKELESLLLASIPADEDALRELAQARALAVRSHLVSLQLPPERIYLDAPTVVKTEGAWVPHVELRVGLP